MSEEIVAVWARGSLAVRVKSLLDQDVTLRKVAGTARRAQAQAQL